jgi:hypothetical protein
MTIITAHYKFPRLLGFITGDIFAVFSFGMTDIAATRAKTQGSV